MRILAAGWIAAVTLAPCLAAQEADSMNPHAILPERPTVATHAETVAPGWIEIETGFERDHSAAVNSAAAPTVLKVGVASHLQLELFGSVNKPAGVATGIGDAGVNLKWRLLDDAPVLGDFAILPALKLPTGSEPKGTGTGTTDGSLLIISSHKLGPVSMDLNAGVTHRSGDGSTAPRTSTLWTASLGGPAAGPLGWVAEVYGYPATRGTAGQPSIVAFLAGPTYLLREWLGFDAGFVVPISGAQPHALYAGGVVNAGRLW